MDSLNIDVMRPASFLSGVVLTAVIAAAIKRWHERPRPDFDVLSISIDRKADADDSKVPLEYSLLGRIRDSALLPEIEPTPSLAQLEKWQEEAERGFAANQIVIDFLQGLLDRPHLLQPGLETDQQRQTLLRDWNPHGEVLDRFCTATLHNLRNEVPSRYRDRHPPEWARGNVHLTTNASYNLSEIDVEEMVRRESAVKGPVGLEDRLRRELTLLNIYRRYWIHLQEKDLTWLFAKAKEMACALQEEAQAPYLAIKELASQHTPKFIRVELLCRNTGARAYSVQPEAQLAVRLKSQGGEFVGYSVDLELDGGRPNRTSETHTVAASGADKLTFYSTASLQLLKLKDGSGAASTTGGDRLQVLYEEDVLRCRVAINLIGVSDQPYTAQVSPEVFFGKGVSEKRREELRQTVIKAAVG